MLACVALEKCVAGKRKFKTVLTLFETFIWTEGSTGTIVSCYLDLFQISHISGLLV